MQVAGRAAIWSGVRPGSSGQSLIGDRQLPSGSSAVAKSASMKQQHSSAILVAPWRMRGQLFGYPRTVARLDDEHYGERSRSSADRTLS